MTKPAIPSSQHPLAGGQRIDTRWWKFLNDLATAAERVGAGDSASDDVEAIARLLGSPDGSVAGIAGGFLRDSTKILGGAGIEVSGLLSSGVVTISASSKNFADTMSRISLRF